MLDAAGQAAGRPQAGRKRQFVPVAPDALHVSMRLRARAQRSAGKSEGTSVELPAEHGGAVQLQPP